jgi:hypothetical protein
MNRIWAGLRLIRNGDPVPAGFSDAEKTAFAGVNAFYKKGFGYAEMMNTRPQTIGYGLSDSPVGLAAFFYEVDKGGHFAAWEQPELFVAEVRAAFRSLR